jgi:hypothetical protein
LIEEHATKNTIDLEVRYLSNTAAEREYDAVLKFLIEKYGMTNTIDQDAEQSVLLRAAARGDDALVN